MFDLLATRSRASGWRRGADLALLYEVETKMLNRAVKRNLKRFRSDFMFQLSAEEADDLRYQIGTSKKGRGGRRYLPYVFTEQGVAMLSSVLNSERALLVNVEIIRAFVKLRQMMICLALLTPMRPSAGSLTLILRRWR